MVAAAFLIHTAHVESKWVEITELLRKKIKLPLLPLY
jgi:hypothetical protein